jgi:hypothetical protein
MDREERWPGWSDREDRDGARVLTTSPPNPNPYEATLSLDFAKRPAEPCRSLPIKTATVAGDVLSNQGNGRRPHFN